MNFRKIAIIVCITISVSFYIILGVIYIDWTKNISFDKEKMPKNTTNFLILDKDENPMNENNYTKLQDVPKYLPQAFIAMEDKRFYYHMGIDPIRIIGASIANIKTGKSKQGASTITCQLMKNTQLSSEKTFKRKVQEAKLALQAERLYTKSEIMEMYLNVLYFGKGIYGIGNAAKTIFGKKVKDLTITECAALSASIANPSLYSPITENNKNRQRRELVLKEMYKSHFIDQQEFHDATNDDIIINYDDSYNNKSTIDTNLILNEANSTLNDKSKQKLQYPLTIHSYVDTELQKQANTARTSLLPNEENTSKDVLIMDNKSAGIIAYTGDTSPFSFRRQPGSVIKPIIYATGVEKGQITTQTQFFDARKSFGKYSPHNYKDNYDGWISAEQALSKSSNVIAVELLQSIGIDHCFKKLELCGFSLSEQDKTLSLALGGTTYGSTISEIASAYATLANYGLSVSPTFIRKITDKNGKCIYENSQKHTRALSSSAAYITTLMLKNTAQNGTASQLSYLNMPIAAKTGTVAKENGNSDAWIAGYTTEHTFICRYSSKDGAVMSENVTGGNQPTKTIRQVLSFLYNSHTPSDFIKPATVRYVRINSDIKDNFHLLVPSSDFEAGKTEAIPVIENYVFDHMDKKEFYLKNLSILCSNNGIHVSFDRIPNVTYAVYADNTPCTKLNDDYYSPKSTRTFVKVQIICKYKNKEVFRQTRLVVPYDQRVITSTSDSASSISLS